MATIKLGPVFVLIGLGVALFFGGASVLAFAPWWVWAGILFLIVYLLGNKK